MTSTRIYGWLPQAPDHRDHVFAASAPVSGLPESIDLRTYMPPVFDQGQLGSCTAQAASAALFMAQLLKRGDNSAGVGSRLFIYYNERLIDHTTRQDAGATIRDSMKSLATYGCMPENLWPYDVAQFRKKPAKPLYDTAKAYVRVGEYQAVGQSVNALQVALANQHPVCVGISVYDSFESAAVAHSGIVPIPKKAEALLGGHALLLFPLG